MLPAIALKADEPNTVSWVFVLADISNEPDDEESLVRFSGTVLYRFAKHDGDLLRHRWFVHPEAGTMTDDVALQDDTGEQTALVVPQVDKSAALHVILQVEDDGTPSFIAYRRAIFKVAPRLPPLRMPRACPGDRYACR